MVNLQTQRRKGSRGAGERGSGGAGEQGSRGAGEQGSRGAGEMRGTWFDYAQLPRSRNSPTGR
ncbi:hypothetical protein JYQ62_08215 [Nostoc sp. UHCC 0702]|nr:hypothetical protein JYQ62_08215 [Nostoc sp. UHCC 0702]